MPLEAILLRYTWSSPTALTRVNYPDALMSGIKDDVRPL